MGPGSGIECQARSELKSPCLGLMLQTHLAQAHHRQGAQSGRWYKPTPHSLVITEHYLLYRHILPRLTIARVHSRADGTNLHRTA